MRCALIRDIIHYIFRRTAKSTGNEYWANPDLSPHYFKIGEDWIHAANREELAQFQKYGIGYTIHTEYKNKKLIR